jgi:hypothetical protein
MIIDGHNTSNENRLDVSAGGLLVGPGTEMSDEIKAASQIGTGILNAEAVRLIGKDQIDALVKLATEARLRLALSAGEYAVPVVAVAAMGWEFFDRINQAGNALRFGDADDPEALCEEIREHFAAGLRDLTTVLQEKAEVAASIIKEFQP